MSNEIRRSLVLLAGLPGAGKTAYASKLQGTIAAFGKTSTVVAPDLLPVIKDDDVYDECKAVFTHRLCLKLTRAKLGIDYDFIIVDSTNLTAAQRSDYVELCRQFNVDVECHASVPDDIGEVAACAERSSKKVPLRVVEKMAYIFDIPRRFKSRWVSRVVDGIKVTYFKES